MTRLTHFGARPEDIERRETSILSWLASDPYGRISGSELAGLFNEGFKRPYARPVNLLTELALKSLAEKGVIHGSVVNQEGRSFQVFSLVDQSVAKNIVPEEVELTPREVALLSVLDIRPEQPQTAAELDERFGPSDEANLGRTEACLHHLAALGLVNAVEDPRGAYQLA